MPNLPWKISHGGSSTSCPIYPPSPARKDLTKVKPDSPWLYLKPSTSSPVQVATICLLRSFGFFVFFQGLLHLTMDILRKRFIWAKHSQKRLLSSPCSVLLSPAEGMNCRLEGAHLYTTPTCLHLPSWYIAPDLKHFLVLPNCHLLLRFAPWPDLCWSITGIVWWAAKSGNKGLINFPSQPGIIPQD